MVLIYVFTIGVIAVLYFLPGFIARNKRHVYAIERLNLFLGWTGLGWIVALIWAVMSPKKAVATPTKRKCPLCETEKDMAQETDTLYGHVVCSKCYHDFANRRQLAFIIDFALWDIGTVLVVFAGGLIFAMGGVPDSQLEGGARILRWMFWPTFFLKDGFRGHSPGKAMMGLQVVHVTSDEPAGFWTSFKRNLPLAIPFMTLIVAVQLYKGHRWGDGWSESRVIWKKYRDQVPFAISRVGS